MHIKRLLSLLLLLITLTATATAQQRNTRLTIHVNTVEGDHIAGQPVTLTQDEYQVSYGALTLNADGECTLKVFTGSHTLTIERPGFITVNEQFVIADGETERTVTIDLAEQTRAPFAVKAELDHNVYTGQNSVCLTWNTEAPAFFDDFEDYEPFAVTFGEWTGIDADVEAAAPLLGSYPNRGVMQYAQIINPLTVNPTWWYDYPILRPFSGQQYVGFTRTSSGNANDDWLISPRITVGTDNVLSFLAKAADQFPERFMVYVCLLDDNCQGTRQEDFTRIDPDNYETADYTGWRECNYDLSAYAGKDIKFAIRYISHYNLYGSFMLMVDDVYVGQLQDIDAARSVTAACARAASAANANERFRIYLDGELKATTTDLSYRLDEVPAGTHTIGIQAVYIQAESEVTTVSVDVPGPDHYASLTFRVTADSQLSPDGQRLQLLDLATAKVYEQTVADAKAIFASLPHGHYVATVDEGAFEAYQQEVTVTADATVDVALTDHIIDPYNITATRGDDGIYTLRWNQELIFSDSFEDYDDFATGSFGDWLSIDADEVPVYPIALGSMTNIVAFPGSGTANNPTAIAPMVFNPWHTTPAMLPTDKAIAAPTGDKTVIFFSSQRAYSDDWLISPLLDIHEGYQLSVKAKAYSTYPESLEFCVSDGGTRPADFTVISVVDEVSEGQWAIYTTDLAPYAGQQIRIAVHYTSYDAFLTQIDDFTVGPESGEGETVNYGNVVRYEISLDGEKIAEVTTPEFRLPQLTDGDHTIGIKAVYRSGQSQEVTYLISVGTGIARPVVSTAAFNPALPYAVYSLSGALITSVATGSRSTFAAALSTTALPAGIYIVKQNDHTFKVRK